MIPPDERAKLRSFGDAAAALNRVLDELERVERERDRLASYPPDLREAIARGIAVFKRNTGVGMQPISEADLATDIAAEVAPLVSRGHAAAEAAHAVCDSYYGHSPGKYIHAIGDLIRAIGYQPKR